MNAQPTTLQDILEHAALDERTACAAIARREYLNPRGTGAERQCAFRILSGILGRGEVAPADERWRVELVAAKDRVAELERVIRRYLPFVPDLPSGNAAFSEHGRAAAEMLAVRLPPEPPVLVRR